MIQPSNPGPWSPPQDVPTDRVGAHYGRYSSDSQKDTSLEDQQRRCRERANQDGLSISPEFEFSDAAVSGSTIERRGLEELRAAASHRKFTDLYVDNLSRLSRECWFAFLLLKELVEVNHIRIVSVSENVDSKHPGWFQLCVLLSMHHEQFLKDHSSNVKRGQEGTVLSGFSIGDTCYGYASINDPNGAMVGHGRNAKPRKVYSIIEDHARWVVQIFRWYADDGRSTIWITRELNRLSAPKNPRSKHARWYPDLVKGILRSEKYVGCWPWRSTRRIRNPVTGKIRQERVPDHERAKYTREFASLQIVESDLFDRAQLRLQKSRDAVACHRDTRGRIRGSSARGKKRFLLDGLLVCSSCKRRLSVLDQQKAYYSCLGNCRGECSVSTSVPRQIAEKMVFDVVAERLLHCDKWRAAVLQAATDEWHRQVRAQPDERATLLKRRTEIEYALSRLISMVETMQSPAPTLATQISERERELLQVNASIRRFEQTSKPPKSAPTSESVAEELQNLLDVFNDPTPNAIEAFQRLFAGPIEVEEFAVCGRKRKFSAGVVKTSPFRIARALSGGSEPDLQPDVPEEVRLEFRRITVTEKQARRALALWNDGRYCEEIAKDLGVAASRVTAIFKFGHEVLGLPYPDTKRRKPASSIYTRLERPVMEAYHAGRLCNEIAEEHRVSRPTIRTIIARWHEARGLTVEDGRTRRKSLSNPARPYRTRDGASAGHSPLSK